MNFSTALSALRANQVALDVVGNNIANATTPDYHRQDARFAARQSILLNGHRVGQGVDVTAIHRAYDTATEEAITGNISELQKIVEQSRAVGRIEALLTPGQGTVLDKVESFFNEVERLTAHQDSQASRTVVLRAAEDLAVAINRLNGRLNEIQTDLDELVRVTLNEIEEKSAELIDLDDKIRVSEARGEVPNNLLDRRTQLINELAELIDIRPVTQLNTGSDRPYLEIGYQLADSQLTFMKKAPDLRSYIDQFGSLTVAKRGSQQTFTTAGGKLGGLLAARNGSLSSYRDSLRELTHQLISALDTAHATGVGLSGGFQSLVSQRRVDDTTALLSDVDSVTPIQQGSLFVSVTDPTGQRTQYEVLIDPATQTVDDLAAAISAINNIDATADPTTGKVIFGADASYTFDFRSGLATVVDNGLITGTTTPEFAGAYTGTTNESYGFRFLGSGDIGLTNNLQVEVTDGSGGVVAIVDVGSGYEPGTEILITSGISVKMSQGSANLNDQFTLDAVAQADTSGVLAALGVNTLFLGVDPGTLKVDPRLMDNPEQFATTTTGNALDTSNAIEMLNVRDQLLLSDGTQTAEEFFTDMIASVGVESRLLSDTQTNLEIVAETLKARRAAISGVDLNEEAVRLLQFQKSFQANARYIVTIEEMLDELFNILR